MFRNTTERLPPKLDMQTTPKQPNCFRPSNTYHQSTNTSSSHQSTNSGHSKPTDHNRTTNHPNSRQISPQNQRNDQPTKQNQIKTDTNKPKRRFHLKTSNKTKNKTLKMVQININGIQNSLIELHQQLIEQSIDIALIQETKLHPETPDPNIPDYTAYRQDRPIKPKTEEEAKEENSSKNQATKSKTKHKSNINGGGLITYVKNDFPSTTIPPPNLPSTSNIE
jgi:hypothetical protein